MLNIIGIILLLCLLWAHVAVQQLAEAATAGNILIAFNWVSI